MKDIILLPTIAMLSAIYPVTKRHNSETPLNTPYYISEVHLKARLLSKGHQFESQDRLEKIWAGEVNKCCCPPSLEQGT